MPSSGEFVHELFSNSVLPFNLFNAFLCQDYYFCLVDQGNFSFFNFTTNSLIVLFRRQLTSLTQLQTLQLRNTQRNLNNIPPQLDVLTNLTDVDLSYNEISKVPEGLYKLSSLKRLNLSSNCITEMDITMGEYLKMLWMLWFDHRS